MCVFLPFFFTKGSGWLWIKLMTGLYGFEKTAILIYCAELFLYYAKINTCPLLWL